MFKVNIKVTNSFSSFTYILIFCPPKKEIQVKVMVQWKSVRTYWTKHDSFSLLVPFRLFIISLITLITWKVASLFPKFHLNFDSHFKHQQVCRLSFECWEWCKVKGSYFAWNQSKQSNQVISYPLVNKWYQKFLMLSCLQGWIKLKDESHWHYSRSSSAEKGWKKG